MSDHYASFGRRLVATFLDALVLAIPLFVMNRLIPVVGGLLLLFLYAPFLESSPLRATIGKYWMGIQVTDVAGGQISLRAGLIRTLVKVVSSTLLFIGHLFALFTEKRQAAHDLVAETIVVYGRNEGLSIIDVWFQSVREGFGGRPAVRSSLDELERLQALREKGAISEEEFQEQKRKLLR